MGIESRPPNYLPPTIMLSLLLVSAIMGTEAKKEGKGKGGEKGKGEGGEGKGEGKRAKRRAHKKFCKAFKEADKCGEAHDADNDFKCLFVEKTKGDKKKT